MRKLVTVRTVAELRPIEGADLIELAIIDGWQCVVKKGEFKIGDKGLYFEIDSFVPASDERFKFLEKNFTLWRNHYGARIKTIKLRGQVSQGLLLPVTQFPEIKPGMFGWESDFAESLGVLKWERDTENDKPREQKKTWLGTKLKKLKYTRLKPFALWLERTFPALFLSNATRPFPGFIPRTDEERVQNLVGKQGFYNDEWYEATVKLDGSSMTVYCHKGKFGVCSRNWDLKKDPENQFWAVALELQLHKNLKKLKRNIAIQGELMGPGIQGNREKLVKHRFFVYKMWDIDAQKYIDSTQRGYILRSLNAMGSVLEQVPFVGMFTTNDFKDTGIEGFLAQAEGPSLNAQTREGLVFTKPDGTKGFKVVATSFLLKEEK